MRLVILMAGLTLGAAVGFSVQRVPMWPLLQTIASAGLASGLGLAAAAFIWFRWSSDEARAINVSVFEQRIGGRGLHRHGGAPPLHPHHLMFNQRRPRGAIDRHSGAVYVQHNPHVADGEVANSNTMF